MPSSPYNPTTLTLSPTLTQTHNPDPDLNPNPTSTPSRLSLSSRTLTLTPSLTLSRFALSNRCFPTKAVNVWLKTNDLEHVFLVGNRACL